MKKINYLNNILIVVCTFFIFLSCTQDPEIKEVVSVPVVKDYPKGNIINYNNKAYLITRNIYDENNQVDVNKDLEDKSVAENREYIEKYLTLKWNDVDFRQSLIEKSFNITEYIELFDRTSVKNNNSSDSGKALVDKYIYVDKNLKKIAEICVTWDAETFCKFYFDLTTQEECYQKFDTLSEEELREYNPISFELRLYEEENIEVSRLEHTYDYYEDSKNSESENYKKVNYGSLLNSAEYCDYFVIDGFYYPSWRTEKSSNGEIHYQLLDKDSNKFCEIMLRPKEQFENDDVRFGLIVFPVNTHRSLYQMYYCKNPLDVRHFSVIDNEVQSIEILSQEDDIDYSKDMSFTLECGSKHEQETTKLVDIHTITDLMKASPEQTTVNGYTVPDSITYYSHFLKDENGEYPILDKYATATLYPEWDDTVNRIVYKVTEKTIKDFINNYKADFMSLYSE